MKTLITLLLAMLAIPALASGLEVKTGQWETTTTTTNSMMPQPMTSTTSACLEKGTFEAEDMMEGAEGCQVKDSTVSGNTLSFEMTCSVQGSETMVKGSFFSEGESSKGNMQMSMKMGEMKMEVSTEWTSRYIGPCE